VSNAYGVRPLVVGEAAAAVRTEGAQIREGTQATLTVSGASSFIVPVGAEVITDPIDVTEWSETDIAVDLYLPEDTGTPTWHWMGLETSYVSTGGNYVGSTGFPDAAATTDRFFVSGVDVLAPEASAIVALGDSLTNGAGSTVDAHARWSDVLITRLRGRADAQPHSVINQGINGARLLRDGVGAGALARFDRDVLAQSGVKYVIIGFGINDLGLPLFNGPQDEATVSQLILGYRQLIVRGHEKALRVYGATVGPISGSFYDAPEVEEKRQQINEWLRRTAGTPEGFDGVIDYDLALRDPGEPHRVRAELDSGDHLHPNDAGYRAIANAIDLSLFESPSDADLVSREEWQSIGDQ
jgi:lysophospholipase L1-like esterase